MKILICGENPLLLRLIKNELEYDGDEIRLVWSGADAVTQLTEFSPDVLVTEVLLPQLNGFEFISNARKQFPQMIIIVLSNLKAERLIELTYLLGADDFISKPFDPETLKMRIKKVKQGKESSQILNSSNYVAPL